LSAEGPETFVLVRGADRATKNLHQDAEGTKRSVRSHSPGRQSVSLGHHSRRSQPTGGSGGTGNYQETCERFAALLRRFRQVLGLPADAVGTRVIDRGIFSYEIFAQAINSPDYHLITWEKNFQPVAWDSRNRSGQYALEGPPNDAQDTRVFCFEWTTRTGSKRPRCVNRSCGPPISCNERWRWASWPTIATGRGSKSSDRSLTGGPQGTTSNTRTSTLASTKSAATPRRPNSGSEARLTQFPVSYAVFLCFQFPQWGGLRWKRSSLRSKERVFTPHLHKPTFLNALCRQFGHLPF